MSDFVKVKRTEIAALQQQLDEARAERDEARILQGLVMAKHDKLEARADAAEREVERLEARATLILSNATTEVERLTQERDAEKARADAVGQSERDYRAFVETIFMQPLLSRTYPPLDDPALRDENGQDIGLNVGAAMRWLVQRSHEADAAEQALAADRDASLHDPAEQRAERYALEAADLTRQLMAAEAQLAAAHEGQARNLPMPPARWKLPLRWDGEDVLEADGHVLVWEGEPDERAARYFVELVNALKATPLVAAPPALWCETCRDAHGPSGPHVGENIAPERAELLREIDIQHARESAALDAVAAPSDCCVNEISSRICERGTAGCIVLHGKSAPVAAPPADESIFVQHARKQGAADGFQQGWHAALKRIAAGDQESDLIDLVPTPPVAAPSGWRCDHGDCRDHYGDQAAWCDQCRAAPPVASQAQKEEQ